MSLFAVPVNRTLATTALAAGLSATLAACGGGTTQSSDSAGGSTKAASKETIDKFLLAPADAKIFGAQPGPAVTAPTSGGKMSLPYKHVLPLPDGPVGDPKKTYNVCFSQALTGSTWAVAQKDSVELEARRHPNVKVSYYNTNNDPLKQVADLDTCLARHVDAVLVWPHSVEPLTPEIEKIKNSGTVVVGMERTVATRDYSNWVYLDNAKATADLADEVGRRLGGKGVVAETDGAIGSSPQILRRSGFVARLKEKYPNIKVVFTAPTDYSRGQGYKVALDFLQSAKGKKIDAWYTEYTEIGFGVDRALKDAKRKIPQFSIVDGKIAVQKVKDGTFTAIAPWSPVHGDVALRAALYDLIKKPAPKSVLLQQPPVITQPNADQALKQTFPG